MLYPDLKNLNCALIFISFDGTSFALILKLIYLKELKMIFQNRKHAGELLAAKLLKYKNNNPIVLALPRGGVPVAAEIAKKLEAPLDVLIVRKIGAPFNVEL